MRHGRAVCLLYLTMLVSLEVVGDEAVVEGRRVLYVDSYHPEYESSQIKNSAAREILAAAGVQLRFFYMDTKRDGSVEHGQRAGAAARNEIERWRPDLLIASDDAAIQHLVQPYLRDAALPVVFMGVNADASVYGLPYVNTTGHVEVDPIETLIEALSRFTSGRRVGLLTGDTITERKTVQHYVEHQDISFDQIRYVKTFEQWKATYLETQEEVDMLVLRNHGGIDHWNFAAAEAFVLEHARIPTGTPVSPMARVAMLGATKAEAELGRYAASTSLRVLHGTRPTAIPLSENREAEFYLHVGIAQRLGIVFSPALLRQAKTVRRR